MYEMPDSMKEEVNKIMENYTKEFTQKYEWAVTFSNEMKKYGGTRP